MLYLNNMNNVEISNLSNLEFKDMFQNEKLLITKNHDSSVRREILFDKVQNIVTNFTRIISRCIVCFHFFFMYIYFHRII